MIMTNIFFIFTNFSVIFSSLTKLLEAVVSIVLIFLTNSSYSVFSTTSFFTAPLSLLKSTGAGTNLSTSSLSTLFFKLFKPVRTFSNLSISILSISDFKFAEGAV